MTEERPETSAESVQAPSQPDELAAASDDESNGQPHEGVAGNSGPDTGTEATAPAIEPAEPAREHSSGGALSLIAFLLAAVALAGVGWISWQQRGTAEELANRLDTRAEGYASRIEQIDRETQTLQDELVRATSQREATARALSEVDAVSLELRSEVDALRQRQRTTEGAMESLQGISVAARQNWITAEAEYLLEIANTRVTLEKDPTTARAALAAADTRLASLDDPSMVPIREAIADGIAAIDAMPDIDREQLAIRIGSLIRRADEYELAQSDDVRATPAPEEKAAAPDTTLGRLKASLMDVVDRAVTVRRVDEIEGLPLTADQKRVVYANLVLLLELARTALLRGDGDDYEAALAASQDWLDRYFAADDPDVKAAKETISELESADIQPDMPDLSEPLKRLRADDGGGEPG